MIAVIQRKLYVACTVRYWQDVVHGAFFTRGKFWRRRGGGGGGASKWPTKAEIYNSYCGHYRVTVRCHLLMSNTDGFVRRNSRPSQINTKEQSVLLVVFVWLAEEALIFCSLPPVSRKPSSISKGSTKDRRIAYKILIPHTLTYYVTEVWFDLVDRPCAPLAATTQ